MNIHHHSYVFLTKNSYDKRFTLHRRDILPKVVHVSKKKKQLKERFLKTPLLSVNDHFLGIARFKGRYKCHTHDRDELFYVLSGELIIEVKKRRYTLDPGDAILIKKGERHLSMSEKETYVLVFEPQDIKIDYLKR